MPKHCSPEVRFIARSVASDLITPFRRCNVANAVSRSSIDSHCVDPTGIGAAERFAVVAAKRNVKRYVRADCTLALSTTRYGSITSTSVNAEPTGSTEIRPTSPMPTNIPQRETGSGVNLASNAEGIGTGRESCNLKADHLSVRICCRRRHHIRRNRHVKRGARILPAGRRRVLPLRAHLDAEEHSTDIAPFTTTASSTHRELYPTRLPSVRRRLPIHPANLRRSAGLRSVRREYDAIAAVRNVRHREAGTGRHSGGTDYHAGCIDDVDVQPPRPTAGPLMFAICHAVTFMQDTATDCVARVLLVLLVLRVPVPMFPAASVCVAVTKTGTVR